ncbi:integron integrase [Bathymodiolus platifrons methanotrophic gill symbiont]|uniref:integron integrase n=1 Tax=Bathymodiolus platifrons methanotrophic gill symbiont TaxID=113268 RepID=UPI0030B81E99
MHTERAYCDWIMRFIRFHHLQERESLLVEPEKKVEDFLTHLAVQANVAASTQNQAFNALVFLYKQVLKHPLEGVDAARTSKEKRVPVVLTREEVKLVLAFLEGTSDLVVKLLYGGGLRITEAMRLRVQDIDYGFKQITVRNGKGLSDRVTPFSESLMPLLTNHLERVKAIHEQDLKDGHGAIYLPFALSRKYPNAEKEWPWQYVFPSRNLSNDPRSEVTRRHHIDQSTVNKAIKQAVRKAGISKKVSAHTFRHSFATHLLQRVRIYARYNLCLAINNNDLYTCFKTAW